MLAIRQATTADAPTIALLGRITFSETFGHLFEDKNDLLEYHQRTFSVDKINGSLQKEQNIFWLAFYQKLPVSYAKLKLNSTSAFITKPQVCQLQKKNHGLSKISVHNINMILLLFLLNRFPNFH